MGDVFERFVGEKGLVRGDEDVGHREQTCELVILQDVLGEILEEKFGLLLINVQTSRADSARFDALDQGVCFDQGTARGVDQNYAVSHHCNRLSVDHVCGFLGERTVERDDVAFPKELLGGDVGNIGIGNGEFVIGEDIHAEAAADIDENAADLSCANDANALAAQIKAGQSCQAEIEAFGADIGLMGVADDGEEHGHGMLGDSVGGVGGNTHHADVFLARVTQIHIVESRTTQSDQAYAEVGETVDHGCVDGIVDKYANAVKAACQLGGVLTQLRFKKLVGNVVCLAVAFKSRDVVGLGVKKCNFHIDCLAFCLFRHSLFRFEGSYS